MLEDENIHEGHVTEAQATEADDSNSLVDDVFGEEAAEPEKSESQPKKKKEPKPSQEKTETEKPKAEPKAPANGKKIAEEPKPNQEKINDHGDDDDDEASSRRSEVEKLKKALNENQKWGHANNRRLKKVAKLVESLKESGVLNDDEFRDLNDHLNSDPEEEERIESITRDPLQNLIKIADKRVDDLREIYEDDELYDRKIIAFGEYYNTLSKDEKEDLVEELDKISGNELKLAKRMYQIGGKYYDEEVKEIEDAGGFKKLLGKKDLELENMKKKIDKLTNRLLKYEDYDKPTYKVDESRDSLNLVKSKSYDSEVEEFFAERDRNIG